MANEHAQGPDHDDAATVRRLTRDLEDVREQFAATSEILTALGRAGADPSAILDTIVERAASLCGADASQLYLLEDGVFRISRVSGSGMEEYVRYWEDHPSTMRTGRASLVARVALDRRSQQIEDVLDDPDYGRQDLQRLVGFRTMLYAPMIVDDEVVGVLGVWRTTVSPFDERAFELLGVFAAQAAIVVENVGLVRALESRSAELATKVEQLEALREVGEAVSSSLNLQEVLEQIVANAVRLTGTDGGSIMEYVERRRLLRGPVRLRQQRPSPRTAPRHQDPPGVHAGGPGRPGPAAPRGGRPRPRPASTRTSRSCTTTGGARCWPCRCRARTRWSAPW